MLSPAMTQSLTTQLNREFYSSYVYLAMSAWCEDKGIRGFATWMRVQSQEELSHAMIIYNYLNDQGCRVSFLAIEPPQEDFSSVKEMFQTALDHERGVTANFNEIAALAQDERDFATSSFIRFFIDEQVEEESSFREIIDKLKLVGDHGHAIFLLDQEFGQRIFVTPIQLKGF